MISQPSETLSYKHTQEDHTYTLSTETQSHLFHFMFPAQTRPGHIFPCRLIALSYHSCRLASHVRPNDIIPSALSPCRPTLLLTHISSSPSTDHSKGKPGQLAQQRYMHMHEAVIAGQGCGRGSHSCPYYQCGWPSRANGCAGDDRRWWPWVGGWDFGGLASAVA